MKSALFDVIFFDCDSTLVTIEGLDELAKIRRCFDKLKDFTIKTMNGEMPYEEVLRMKFKVLSPSKDMLKKLGEMYAQNLVEDAKEVVEALQSLGKEVYIVTGEIRESVVVLAKKLGVPESSILVNDANFDKDGNFISMKEGPLMTDNGKVEVIKRLNLKGKKLAFVGDGYTDLKAKEAVDTFIGFGGVVVRPNVKKEADIYIESKSLAPLLKVLLTKGEIRSLGKKYQRLLFVK